MWNTHAHSVSYDDKLLRHSVGTSVQLVVSSFRWLRMQSAGSNWRAGKENASTCVIAVSGTTRSPTHQPYFVYWLSSVCILILKLFHDLLSHANQPCSAPHLQQSFENQDHVNASKVKPSWSKSMKDRSLDDEIYSKSDEASDSTCNCIHDDTSGSKQWYFPHNWKLQLNIPCIRGTSNESQSHFLNVGLV